MEQSQSPLLNLYAVRKSQNEKFVIITLVEGQKPNRTFRKWLVPTNQVDGKPQAIVMGDKVHIELPLSKEFKKEVPNQKSNVIYETRETVSIDDDDIPF